MFPLVHLAYAVLRDNCCNQALALIDPSTGFFLANAKSLLSDCQPENPTALFAFGETLSRPRFADFPGKPMNR
jgi:hypothetical protein